MCSFPGSKSRLGGAAPRTTPCALSSRARAARRWASTASNGRATTSSPCRTGPGRATRRAALRRSCSSSPTAPSTSGWSCCAKRSSDRRSGPARRGRAFSYRQRPLRRRSVVSGRAALRDRSAVEQALAQAPRKVQIELVNNRLCGAAIETRGAISTGDALYCGTQTPHHIRRFVCEELGIDEGKLRVVSRDVGGGFGYKGKHYPEETLVVWAARRLRRPVKWIAGRNESFL